MIDSRCVSAPSLGMLFLVPLLLCGCQSTVGGQGGFTAVANTSAPAEFHAVAGAPNVNDAGYRIGAADILTVTVFQVPDLSAQSSKVSNDGTITLPLIGTIRAEGLTADQLTSQIRARLAKYVQSPQVSVSLTQAVSRVYTVEGEINQPGTFPISAGRSLLEAVATAGGFNAVADRSNVTIYRDGNGKRQATKFDVDSIRNGSVQDPVILSGDIISVGASPIRSALQQIMPAVPVGGLGAQVGERVAK